MVLTAAASVFLVIGIVLLRWSWLQKGGRDTDWAVLLGWLAILESLFLFCHALGGERGTAFHLMALSLAGLAGVAATVQIRGRRTTMRDKSVEPEQRNTNWPRAIAKSLLAIVLAGAASIGIGVAFAIAMPMPAIDKMVLGGVAVPILWGAGMAWTLADSKLLRATAILLAICFVSYGIAFLPKLFA